MQTLQQQRARYALEKVKAAVAEATNAPQQAGFECKAFKSQAESFPAMIRMNGLGPAAAFYLSKDGAHKRLYTILSDWLTKNHQPYEGKNLLEGITTGDSQQYRLAQAEALM
ncbi:MAG: type III-B CRISPR module-associated protein Cmr5, partial [Methylococcaceae bacterium]